jgi:hypothetical protein
MVIGKILIGIGNQTKICIIPAQWKTCGVREDGSVSGRNAKTMNVELLV